MDQRRDLSDYRLVNGCIYCGGPEESREHVPSRVFLDRPFPPQLPVVSSCVSCNNSFSIDETYVACLIESVIAGSTKPEEIRRPSVAKILLRTPALRLKLEDGKRIVDGDFQFIVEPDRLKNIVVKLARGHAAFELSQVRRDDPSSVWWYPLHLMTDVERNDFEANHVIEMIGEVGSRGSQSIMVVQLEFESDEGERKLLGVPMYNWQDVQEGRYSYLAVDDTDEIRIKMIISDYLACEVIWAK